MSRIFSIIVSLFILFLAYLWIGHITKRDKEREPQYTHRSEANIASSEKTETKPITTNPEPEADLPQDVEEEAEKDIVRDVNDEKPKIEPDGPPARGGHLVIAGNFLERANAETHLRNIKRLGYKNAEILNFEISQYYTVCAGRFSDPTEARRIARAIEQDHGIDTYVRAGN